MPARGRARSSSNRTLHTSHSHGAPDHDTRHKIASLTAQLIQKDHRIRGLEEGVQTKLAEVRFCVRVLGCFFVHRCFFLVWQAYTTKFEGRMKGMSSLFGGSTGKDF